MIEVEYERVVRIYSMFSYEKSTALLSSSIPKILKNGENVRPTKPIF